MSNEQPTPMSNEERIKMLTASRDNHRAAYTQLHNLCLEAARILRPITDGFEGQDIALSEEYVLKIEEIQSRLMYERPE